MKTEEESTGFWALDLIHGSFCHISLRQLPENPIFVGIATAQFTTWAAWTTPGSAQSPRMRGDLGIT